MIFYLTYSWTEEDGVFNVKFISKNREYPNSELIRHKQIYSKRNIKNLGDFVGIAAAAVGSVPLGGAVSEFGNMLDEYGDGDRGQKASA